MECNYLLLDDCIDLIIDHRGLTPKKLKSDWVNNGVPVISAKNVKNGELKDEDSIRYIDNITYQKWMKEPIRTGDLLLASEGATLGENMMWRDKENIALGQRLFGIRADNKNLYYKYFAFYVNSQEYQHQIFSKSTGTSVLGIKQTELRKTMIKLPSFNIQVFIGNLGDNIQKKIILNKKIIANLEELSQTLFKRWFVDFEFPDENGNPYKSSGGEMVDSELGEIPINWNLVKLGSIANIRTGYAFKSTEYIEQIQLPVLRTLNISKSNLLVTMNDIKFVPYQYLYMDKYQKYNLELFDTLLVTVGGSIGNLGLVTENNLPSLQNQNMWRFRSIKSNISNTLIYQLILYVNSLVYNQTSGSAREFYTKKTFENFNLLLPKLDSYLYESINKYLENFGKKISDLNVEIEKLTQLRDTLLPKLMSGEIEIPDHIEVNEDELSI